ncbi:ATP-dependent DNA helicase RecG [uncultured Parasutterella sp.]|uniref:ATP-dependent DNA helicase RecG n=1 Tax=uncultured Parasutterella sp. TaxID=1263098 RepID=UPI0025F836D4|nr:ATP-dependent DNA helicase RecG [uncultured Parasutterella sp.]
MAEISWKRKPGQKLAPLAERLKKLGLVSDWDFVLHLPLRYEDETSITPIEELEVGVDAQVEGVVTNNSDNRFGNFEAWIDDETDMLKARFIHYYPSIRELLKVGKRVRLYGNPRAAFGGGLEMIHPKVRAPKPESDLPKTLTPVYPAGEGVAQLWLRKRIDRALMDVDISDLLTEEERNELHLPGLSEAINSLHHPKAGAPIGPLQNRTDPAWQRLKFDELLAQQISLKKSREMRDMNKGPLMPLRKGDNNSLTAKFFHSLPFKLTKAQIRVWKDIYESLGSERPMNRLVQGDVGSGKTVIAALAACQAIDAGYQAALMAPTEILAEQHFKKIISWLEPFGVRVVWLSGKQKAKEKREALAAIEDGAELVVGTHAIIQPDVKFKALGLAIVDEQHRFGVDQRLAIRAQQNGMMPHLLMLSATPIPRTLAMSYLADIDVSVIDELPPGRQEISTKLVSMNRKGDLIEWIGKSLAAGLQAYWVCPLIEESEKVDLTAATETCEEIKQILPQFKIELLHGKMTPEDKNTVMERFVKGETKLLVSTTVIEVGVDVPNASIMVIEHAERFGLAQLHQLRGRVGRGSIKSYCFAIFGDQLSKIGKERLQVFNDTTDGFEISRRDLELRGPGEFLGARQSGAALLRFADFETDGFLVEKAMAMADKWIREKDPRAEKHAARWYQSKEKYLEA